MTTRNPLVCRLPFLISALLLVSCGKKPEPVSPDVQTETVETETEDSGMGVMGELGGLNQEQVERVFHKASKALAQCVARGSQRIEFLGGTISFYLLIDQGGGVAHSHVKDSTLGDRETEKCMLDILAQQRWPKPVGGERGKAEYDNITFDPPNDVREPVNWDAAEIEEELGELAEDLDACRDGAGGSFTATMYVGTDGKPLGVGMASAGEEGGGAIDCLVEVLMRAEFPSPGSWPAKVTFGL